MRLGTIAIIVIGVYLAVSLPLYFLNEQSLAECSNACSEEGYDLAIAAVSTGQGLECRCVDSNTRLEKNIIIS